jgi:hypothetical protein
MICDIPKYRVILITPDLRRSHARMPRFGSFYTARMGVEVHKMYVIWVTAGGPYERADVSGKGLIDLGSQLAGRL